MLRSAIRKSLEVTLTASGVTGMVRNRGLDRLHILAYHNVVPQGSAPMGDQSLHLPVDRFQHQLDFLQEHFRIVGLEEIESLEAPSDKPTAAITFDDAYFGAVSLGIPEVVERGFPVTVFVCPGLLAEGGFWWDRLSMGASGLPPGIRETALGELQGRQDAILSSISETTTANEFMLPASSDHLSRIAENPNVTLASHTWGHPNLSALEEVEIKDELLRSREWLKEHFPDSTLESHISFPYGLFNPEVVRIAEDLGFRFFYKISGGAEKLPVSSPFLLPRLNIPSGLSLRGFELRLSGFFN